MGERIRVLEWQPDDPYPRAAVEPWPDEPGDTVDVDAIRDIEDRMIALFERIAAARGAQVNGAGHRGGRRRIGRCRECGCTRWLPGSRWDRRTGTPCSPHPSVAGATGGASRSGGDRHRDGRVPAVERDSRLAASGAPRRTRCAGRRRRADLAASGRSVSSARSTRAMTPPSCVRSAIDDVGAVLDEPQIRDVGGVGVGILTGLFAQAAHLFATARPDTRGSKKPAPNDSTAIRLPGALSSVMRSNSRSCPSAGR